MRASEAVKTVGGLHLPFKYKSSLKPSTELHYYPRSYQQPIDLLENLNVPSIEDSREALKDAILSSDLDAAADTEASRECDLISGVCFSFFRDHRILTT